MRLKGSKLHHVAGWTGGVHEDAEPDLVERGAAGVLDDGLNLTALPGRRLAVRGGSVVVQTFSAVGGNAVSDVLGLFRYTPTGAVAVAHVSAGPQHYAYALDSGCQFALPAGAGTEAASRVSMVWASATAARPYAVELFEKLYIVDANVSGRQNMAVFSVPAGVPTIANPVYDLDGSGAGTAGIAANCISAYNGVLFVSGYDSETGGLAPHLLRHSFLARDPATATGFDPDGYAVIGSLNVPIRAHVPGNSILLVAKDHELYRISGAGKAVAGWQYAISQLDNTLGLGCTNPYALAFAAGHWYGVGENGPWRSDGQTVTSLVDARKRSWALVDEIQLAQVVHHPERRKVLFGFYKLGYSSYATAPFQWWKWDLDTASWDLDDRFARSFWMATAIPTTVDAPTNPPSALVQSFSFGDFQESSVTGTFAAGDVTAETEVWAYTEGGVSTLQTTLPDGVARFTVTATQGQVTTVRLRHTKNGIAGDYSAYVDMYPKLRTPRLSVDLNTGSRFVEATTYFNDGDMYASSSGWAGATWTGIDAGLQTALWSTSQAPATFALYAEDLTWPASYRTTNSVECQTYTPVYPTAGGFTPSEPRQVFADGLALTSLIVVWCPYTYNDTYVVEYRVTGSGSGYTTASTYTTPNNPGFTIEAQEVTITGLAASTKYDVRVRNVAAALSSADVICYTKLASPTTVTATTTGAGTPVVNIAITMPIAGKDVRCYNALETFTALYAAHAVGPTNHASTVGVCGSGDRYFACMTDTSWPVGFRFSDPTSDDIDDPCVVGS